MEYSTYNSIGLAILTVVLGLLVTAFWKARDIRKNKADALQGTAIETNERIHDLEKQLASLTGIVGPLNKNNEELQRQVTMLTASLTPISAAFQAVLIKQLTHFHTPEMDALLEKLEPTNRLEPDESERLAKLLQLRATELNGRIDESEREAALMLPMVMNRVKQGIKVSESEVMVVLVPRDGLLPKPTCP